MISPEARAELDRMFASRGPEKSVEQGRRDWEAEALSKPLPDGARVSQASVGGVACEWVEMPGAPAAPVFVLLHGGGYNAGSPRTHRLLAAFLARATGLRVLLPDYRLAPEHPFPAGVDDALAVYDALLRDGLSPQQIAIGGDSAGGGLTMSLLLALAGRGDAMPRAAVLLSPWTDLTVSSPSYETFRTLDPIITREGLARAGRWYAGTRDPADPMLSSLFADLRGMPPLLIQVGGDETMLDDSKLLAERAAAAGVDVVYRAYPGLWHVFHHAADTVPEARQAIDEIADYLRARFSESE